MERHLIRNTRHIRRWVSTTVDAPVIPNELLHDLSLRRVSSHNKSVTDVPKESSCLLVKDLPRFTREHFQISGKLAIPEAVKIQTDSSVLKLEQHLKTGDIDALLQEIDSLISYSPAILEKFTHQETVFILARKRIRLYDVPIFYRLKKKKQLAGMVSRLMNYYNYLKDNDALTDSIVENTAKTLIKNNRVIQAHKVLKSYPRNMANINLVNILTQIVGDGIPETWNFPYGKLDFGENSAIEKKIMLDAATCTKLVQDSGFAPNLVSVNNLLLIVAKSHNMKLVEEIIAKTWGIPDGGDQILGPDSVLYPDSTTLLNILYSYSLNEQYVEGVGVMVKMMKCYDFQLNNTFWIKWFNILRVSLPKDKLKLDLHQFGWNLMKDYNAEPSLAVYSAKLRLLKEFHRMEEMMHTLPELQKIQLDKDPVFGKIVLEHYIKAILMLQAQRNLYNQSLTLVETWSPDEEFKNRVMKKLQTYYASYYNRMSKTMAKRQTDTLIEDEEDDDNDFSLW